MDNNVIVTGNILTEIDKLERFTFGKHKGKLINAVRITDPQYLQWLSTTDSRFNISDGWRMWIEDYANKNKDKIYAGSYRNKVNYAW